MFGRKQKPLQTSRRTSPQVRLPPVPETDGSKIGNLDFLFDLIEDSARAVSVGHSSRDSHIRAQSIKRSEEITNCSLLGLGMITPEGMSQARDMVYCMARMSVAVGNHDAVGSVYTRRLTEMAIQTDDTGSVAMTAMSDVESAVWHSWNEGRTKQVQDALTEFLLPKGDLDWGIRNLRSQQRFIPLALGAAATQGDRVWDVLLTVAN